jgi:hypothetical protein
VSAQPLTRLALVFVALTSLTPLILAQPGRPGQPGRPNPPFQPGQPGRPNPPFQPGQPNPNNADTAAGCAACGGAFVFIIILSVAISIVTTIIWVFVLIWVAKDAKSRGMDNGAMWVVLVLFTGVIGLVIYIVSREQGDLVLCRDCGNKRLRESRRCPHCRAA